MNRNLLLLTSLSVAAASLSAESLTINIDAFEESSQFDFLSSSLDFRFAELAASGGTNEATHILIEGLQPIGDSAVHSSNYSAVNIADGSIQDVGVVYLTLPDNAALPEGTVASPIVGVVQRAGSWADFSPTPQSGSTVGESSGSGDYSSEGVLTLSLVRGGETFSGSADYTVVDEDTVNLDAFTLVVDGSVSYSFEATTLVRDGSRFYGTILADGASIPYNSLIFAIEFINIPDLDGDSIPDLVDDNIVQGLDLIDGEWQDNPSLGLVFGSSDSYGFSESIGHIFVENYPWIHTPRAGWIEFQQKTGDNQIFWSPTLGWVFVADDAAGTYFANDGSGWVSGTF